MSVMAMVITFLTVLSGIGFVFSYTALDALARAREAVDSNMFDTRYKVNGQWWMAANLMPFDEWKARQCKSK